MKEVNGDFILEEISKLLEPVECDYILAIFPSGDSSHAMASIGLNIQDLEHVAFVLSRLIMYGDDLGWSVLELLQQTCRQFPVPLHHLLAASRADYEEITMHNKKKEDGQKAVKRIKK